MTTITLSDHNPSQTDAGASGLAYTVGDQVTVWQNEDGGWAYCYHGVGWNGNAYEGDDIGSFETREDALEEAITWYLEKHLTPEEVDEWYNGDEPARLERIREQAGIHHFEVWGHPDKDTLTINVKW